MMTWIAWYLLLGMTLWVLGSIVNKPEFLSMRAGVAAIMILLWPLIWLLALASWIRVRYRTR